MSAPRTTRLLCPECHSVQVVKSTTDFVATLDCEHQRTERTLPSAPGAASFESLRSQVGQKLFPLQRDEFRPLRIKKCQ
jgi:hypothetical protein